MIKSTCLGYSCLQRSWCQSYFCCTVIKFWNQLSFTYHRIVPASTGEVDEINHQGEEGLINQRRAKVHTFFTWEEVQILVFKKRLWWKYWFSFFTQAKVRNDKLLSTGHLCAKLTEPESLSLRFYPASPALSVSILLGHYDVLQQQQRAKINNPHPMH